MSTSAPEGGQPCLTDVPEGGQPCLTDVPEGGQPCLTCVPEGGKLCLTAGERAPQGERNPRTGQTEKASPKGANRSKCTTLRCSSSAAVYVRPLRGRLTASRLSAGYARYTRSPVVKHGSAPSGLCLPLVIRGFRSPGGRPRGSPLLTRQLGSGSLQLRG